MSFISEYLLLDLPFYQTSEAGTKYWPDKSNDNFSVEANDKCESSTLALLGKCLHIKSGGNLTVSKPQQTSLAKLVKDPTKDLTVEFWAKPDQAILDSNNKKFILRGPVSVWMQGQKLYWVDDQQAYSISGIGNDLHHWAIVRNSQLTKQVAFFRDGVEIDTDTIPSESTDSASEKAFMIGGDSANGWTGKLAHLRLWHSALTASQLQTHIKRDVTAHTAFKATSGIDWRLINADDEPSLYIHSNQLQELRLELENSKDGITLVIPQNESDQTTSFTNSHFCLVFRPGTIASSLLRQSLDNSLINAIRDKNPGWSINVIQGAEVENGAQGNEQDCICFRRTGEDIELKTDERLTFWLPGLFAAAGSGSRTTQVMLKYQNLYLGNSYFEETNRFNRFNPLAKDSSLYLKLDSPSVQDSSPAQNTCEVQGNNLEYVSDPEIGDCLNFGGSSHINCGAIDLTDTSFTIQFWAKLKQPETANGYVIGQGTIARKSKVLHIGFRGPNEDKAFTLGFWASDLNVPDQQDTNWHHWACVYDRDAGTQAIYKDSQQIGTRNVDEPYQGTGDFLIGKVIRLSTTGCFKGRLADIMVHKRALSASEIDRKLPNTLDGHRVQVLNILYRALSSDQNPPLEVGVVEAPNGEETYQNPPLEVGVVGAPVILNNGEETTLTIYIKNVNRDADGNASQLLLGTVKAPEDKQAKFSLEMDTVENNSWTGLGDLNDLKETIVSKTSTHTNSQTVEITPQNSSNIVRWKITGFEELNSDETIFLTIKGLKTTAPVGRSILRLRYEDFDKYGEGVFKIPIEKAAAIPARVTQGGSGYGLALGHDPRTGKASNVEVLNEMLSIKQVGAGDAVRIENTSGGSGLRVVNTTAVLNALDQDLGLHLKLDSLLVEDSSPAQNTCEVSGNLQYVSDPTIGGCIEFDGNSHINCGVIDLPDTGFTIQFWAKIKDFVQNRYVIEQRGNGNYLKIGFHHSNLGFIFWLRPDLYALTGDQGDTDWHHWSCVYKDKTLTIYKDQQEIATRKANDFTYQNADYPLTIGKGVGDSGPRFKGRLANIMVHKRALSKSELIQTAAYITNRDNSCGLVVTQNGNSPSARFVGGSGVKIDGGLKVRKNAVGAGDTVWIENTSGGAGLHVVDTASVTAVLSNALKQDLSLHLKLDSLLVEDSSPAQKTCEVSGNLQYVSDPTMGGCIEFDGNSHINCGAIDLPDTGFTIQFWAKLKDFVQKRSVIGQRGNSNFLEIGFDHYNQGVFFKFRSNLSAFAEYQVDTDWHHWSCVYKDKTLTIYKDQQEIATQQFNDFTYRNTDYPLMIGQGRSSATSFKGRLANIMVHKRALSKSELIQTAADITNRDNSRGLVVTQNGGGLSAQFVGGSGVKIDGALKVSKNADIDGKLKVRERIHDKTGVVMPVGAVLPFAGKTAPEGWLLCDGQLVSGPQYLELAEVLDKTLPFTVPDYRERFIVGASGQSSYNLDDRGGTNEVKLTWYQMPSHKHQVELDKNVNQNNAGEHQHLIPVNYGYDSTVLWTVDQYIVNDADVLQFSVGKNYPDKRGDVNKYAYTHGGGTTQSKNQSPPAHGKGGHSHSVTVAATGGNGAHENRPPFVALNYIIKY